MAEFHNNRTFSFKGRFRDSQGEEAIVVESDGFHLRTSIRGIAFEGTGLDQLMVDGATQNADLDLLPLCENKDHLCDCHLVLEMPVALMHKDRKGEAVLYWETWVEAPNDVGYVRARSRLTTQIDGEEHAVDSDWLEDALSKLGKNLAGVGQQLRCCHACRLSIYHPFEGPQMGQILCLRGIKAEFLSLHYDRPKQQFGQLKIRERADEFVTEAHCCPEFVQRVTEVPTRQIYPSPGFLHYWTEGHGPVLLQKLSHVPTRAEIDAESFKLLEFDALGDEVIRDVYQAMGFEAAGALLDKVLRKGIASAPEAPTSLKRMLEASETLPGWVDWDKLELGAQFCRRSGSLGLIVLRNYCLMGGYESSAINKPLIATGALKKGAAKRMAETVEFWVSATGEGAMRLHAVGYRSAIKVRLMHAYARVAVRASGTWNSQDWGEPINQWDMVATNLGFSLAYLDGLRSLGFRPSDAEVEGLLHFWKYIGYLLGIPAQYLPDTEAEAIRTLYHWTITQPPADADTCTLARALLDEPLSSRYLPFMWMKRMLCKTHLSYNHFFLGARSCTTMGLPESRLKWYPRLVRGIVSSIQYCINHSTWLLRRSVKAGRKSQVRIMNVFLGRKARAAVD